MIGAGIVINDYSVTQVKIDDEMIDKVLDNILPQEEIKMKAEASIEEEAGEETPSMSGLDTPKYENLGQKRFKKIASPGTMERFRVQDNITPVRKKVHRGPVALLSDLVMSFLTVLPRSTSKKSRRSRRSKISARKSRRPVNTRQVERRMVGKKRQSLRILLLYRHF